MDITKRFVVVSVNQSSPSRQREDKALTDKVAKETGSQRGAHKVQKRLYPEAVLDGWDKACSALRNAVTEITTPWLSDGEYLLCIGAMMDLQDIVNEKKLAAMKIADELEARYDAIIAECQVFRNGAFNRNDYPATAGEFRRKFKLNVQFRPVENERHILVEAAEDELRLLQESTATQIKDKVEEIRRGLCDKITADVQRLIDRLAAKDRNESAPLHESVIENISHLAKHLPNLNVSGSEDIAAMQHDLKELTIKDVSILKHSRKSRQDVAEKAKKILNKLATIK